ncbi:MAG TPA: hypothetical protein VEI06_16455 [Gemmatimonadaceae bacterium]|nr:hypothetical protein [Gemmatimonadaceae bacterium]
MRTHRFTSLLFASLLAAPIARAQQPAGGAAPADTISPQQQAYQQRKSELVKELQTSQDQLSDVRAQRVQLEARIETALAQSMQQRSQALMMSNEQSSLLQLDGMLTQAQDNMVAQRDRMRSLGDAVKHRVGAVLVVLLKADSVAPEALGPLELKVDQVVASTRTYSMAAGYALQQGAVDQLWRSELLPTAHAVKVEMTLGGVKVSQSLNVDTKAETVTYVQFTVQNGQLVPVTWTATGTAPY